MNKMNGEDIPPASNEPYGDEPPSGVGGAEAGFCAGAADKGSGIMAPGGAIGMSMGMSPLLANVALIDSFHGTISSGDDPSTESRMCTEESAERMTSSTEGMVSLSEDSSGRDTYAQAHGVKPWSESVASSARLPPHADTIEQDESDEQMNGLLGSYREISIEDDACVEEGHEKHGSGHTAGEDTEEEVSNLSPDSAPRSPLDDNGGRDVKHVACAAVAAADRRRDDVDLNDTTDEPNRRPNSLRLSPCGGARSRCSATTTSTSSLKRRSQCRETDDSFTPPPLLSSSVPLPPTLAVHPTRSSSASVSSSSELDSMFGALQGLVLRDGDMVSFVAENLHEQIKRASPVVRHGETPSFPGSRSSTPSLYKQAVTPQILPFDPSVLDDLENQVRAIACSVDTVLENLTGTLHSMSSLTVDCMESYHNSVCKTCDAVDSNIKAMYQLMAKFEELGNMMRPVHRLSGQMYPFQYMQKKHRKNWLPSDNKRRKKVLDSQIRKEIKRLLELFEQQVAASSGS